MGGHHVLFCRQGTKLSQCSLPAWSVNWCQWCVRVAGKMLRGYPALGWNFLSNKLHYTHILIGFYPWSIWEQCLDDVSFGKCVLPYCVLLQTDLCGLKWRKYVFNFTCQANPSEDPVLKSFSAALSHDILCAWRRCPLTGCQSGGDPKSISGAKELWVFWFGDDPNLQGIVSAELKGNGSPFL